MPVTIHFARAVPSAGELLVLRRILPRFRDWPPARLQTALAEGGVLHLAEVDADAARQLEEAASIAGFRAQIDHDMAVSLLPLDRTTGSTLMTNDRAARQMIARAMIAARVSIEDVCWAHGPHRLT